MCKYFDEKVKKLKAIDISFVKLSAFLFAFFVAALIPDIVIEYKWYWLLLSVLAAVKPLYSAYIK
ncbi:hypothetical protein DRN74_02610 [Candidatus Micrarchaeota archaeon]|nr:MAG: hypothetical protein DRN74_02610 [Candidatus Micrarchaeota archaeon]